MLGRLRMPQEYQDFNTKWGAPFGYPAATPVLLKQRHERPDPAYGPFAYQLHSGTRTFEYPWAYHAARTSPGTRVLDVGGCVGGLQYVFALEGCAVTNADPCDNESGGWPQTRWPVGPDLHEQLNETFGTNVRLVQKRVQEADLPAGSFDRAISLSVIEHLAPADARDMVEHILSLLVPGGLLVATVDLFLDLKPFGVLNRNCFGTNIDLCRLIDGLDADLVEGDRRELFGFPEFDVDRLVAQIDDLYLSPTYPCLTQALVLRKR
jgi:SAM-dependent methyltransferase